MILNTIEVIKIPNFEDREGQQITLAAYEKTKYELPNFITIDMKQIELVINPTSQDSLGKYVIQLDLIDTFKAKTSYFVTISLQDPSVGNIS